MITLHVDDLTLASDSQSIIDQVSVQLKTKFTMTDDGEITNVLKLSIERNLPEKKIFIHQHSYLNDLLIRFNMVNSQPVKTPMESLTVSLHDCPLPGSAEQHDMAQIPYREACGSLMALATNTRPDILYAVGVACRFMHNPGQKHWHLVKRILKYLNGTRDLRPGVPK